VGFCIKIKEILYEVYPESLRVQGMHKKWNVGHICQLSFRLAKWKTYVVLGPKTNAVICMHCQAQVFPGREWEKRSNIVGKWQRWREKEGKLKWSPNWHNTNSCCVGVEFVTGLWISWTHFLVVVVVVDNAKHIYLSLSRWPGSLYPKFVCLCVCVCVCVSQLESHSMQIGNGLLD